MNMIVPKLLIISGLIFSAIILVVAPAIPVHATVADIKPSGEPITGTVLETMDVSGYTYLNIETAAGPTWVVIPQTSVSTGQDISCEPGMLMQDFHSKSLGRTFPQVIFSSGLVGAAPINPHRMASAPAAPAGKQTDPFAAAVEAEKGAADRQIEPSQMSGGSGGAIAPYAEIKVEKAAGENGYTVAELFEQAQELNGKTVRVRGKVVKYNAGIMGRNWVHLQDGSGDPMHNTHDLVFTTTEEIGSPPDVVTMEGTLAAGKDFGAGYKYDAIVENATAIK